MVPTTLGHVDRLDWSISRQSLVEVIKKFNAGERLETILVVALRDVFTSTARLVYLSHGSEGVQYLLLEGASSGLSNKFLLLALSPGYLKGEGRLYGYYVLTNVRDLHKDALYAQASADLIWYARDDRRTRLGQQPAR